MIEDPKRILLIQLRAIGDVILTTPAVRLVKRRFPTAKIDFVTNAVPAEILQGNPHIHRIIPKTYAKNDILGALRFFAGLRCNRYDIVVDFLGTPGTAQMTFFSGAKTRIGYDLRIRKFAYTHIRPTARSDIYNALAKMTLLEPLGIKPEDPYPEIFVTEDARQWAENYFDDNKLDGNRIVAVAPAAKRQARRWMPEYYAEVSDWLLEEGYSVVMPWGPGEKEYVEGVAGRMKRKPLLTPPLNLMQLAALLQRCQLLLCNCGGTKHFAAAVGTSTLSMYGASDPRAWTPPDDPRHVYLVADVDCINCGLKECESMDCMKRLTPDRVIEAAQKMLEG
ncbi:glycosyltransferase family 9 protein [bacterium]|nr:glycosyltransferase family 9 protein [bacterium]